MNEESGSALPRSAGSVADAPLAPAPPAGAATAAADEVRPRSAPLGEPTVGTHSASGTLRVAAVQMVSSTQVEENLAAARRLVTEAAGAGARLVVLPEYFCLLGERDTDKVDAREIDGDGPIQQFLSELARECAVWLVGGTVPLTAPDPRRVFNSSLAFAPSGRRVARYDKIHLFGFRKDDDDFDESRTIRAGTTPTVLDVDEGGRRWRVGMSICYDLRFPELYRALSPTDLILVPSAFTYKTGRAHWETLLRARAIENQCYVLAPAQGGKHRNGRRTWGHSMFVDPWGETVAVHSEGEGVVIGEIDPARIADVRTSLPALNHRTL